MTHPVTSNSGDRANPQVIYILQVDGDLPTDYKKTTIDAYIISTNSSSTRVKVLEGTDGNSPSAINTEKTTEGNSEVAGWELSGTPSIVAQSPAEYALLKTNFRGKTCRIVKIYAKNIDLNINEANNEVVAIVGDEIEISNKIVFNFIADNVSGSEKKIMGSWAKTVGKDEDSFEKWETVVADA